MQIEYSLDSKVKYIIAECYPNAYLAVDERGTAGDAMNRKDELEEKNLGRMFQVIRMESTFEII